MKKKLQGGYFPELYDLLHERKAEYQKFHESTKLTNIGTVIPYSKYPPSWKKVSYKSYPRMEEIILPHPRMSGITLKESLIKRRSVRNFEDYTVSLRELSTLLYFSAGKKSIVSNNASFKHFETRFYPSAGRRYPLEIYVLSLKSELENGIYHYYPFSHSLEKITDNITKKSIFSAVPVRWFLDASLILFVTAIFERNAIKYGERGYRHVMSELGGLTQNIYLVSGSLRMACCPTGAYLDDKCNDLLNINGVNETVIAAIAVGKEKIIAKESQII